MQMNQLKQMLEIARYQSINKAAQMLNISQPALSATLRELEKELGILLFERTRKGVFPTNEGRQVLLEAEQILECMNRIQLISQSSAILPEIKIAVGNFFESFIPQLAMTLQNHYPNVCLKFLPIDNLALVMDHISKKHYRICLCCFTHEELKQVQEISFIKLDVLFDDIRIGAFLHKSHPLAQNEQIPLRALLAEKLIMPNSPLSQLYFEVYPPLRNTCRMMTLDFFTALHLVAQNVGITLQNILPSQGNPYQQYFPDIVTVPVELEIPSQFVAAMIVPKEAFLSKAEIEMFKIIKSFFQQFA